MNKDIIDGIFWFGTFLTSLSIFAYCIRSDIQWLLIASIGTFIFLTAIISEKSEEIKQLKPIKKSFTYGTKVRIKDGFYKGIIGIIKGKRKIGKGEFYQIKVIGIFRDLNCLYTISEKEMEIL